MFMRRLFMAFLAVLPAWSCSCFSSFTPCSVLGGSSVVFVAEVVVDSGDGWGKGPAKVKIVEPLQNVPDGLKEATIETNAGTSCYRRLQAGERYVIITSGAPYSVSGCNPSFRLTGSDHILDAMRDRVKGGAPRLVGSVLRSTGRYSHQGGIPGAVVELTRGGSRHTATTDNEGRYTMAGLEAGPYQISVRKDRYVLSEENNRPWSGRMKINPQTNKPEPAEETPGEIEISPNSCEIRNLSMWPAGSIRGTVKGVDGSPVQGVSVQAFQRDHQGEGESSPLRTAVTGSDGNYRIEPLPPGHYVVGINARPHRDENAYPPTLYQEGRSVYLDDSVSVAGIDIAVGAPRAPGRLRVKVLSTDAKPHEGAFVRLDTPAGAQRWFSLDRTDGNGELVAPVYVGQRYTVRVFHNMSGNNGIRMLEGTTSVDVTNRESAVLVVLQEQELGRPPHDR
jgi:hypothetical protein